MPKKPEKKLTGDNPCDSPTKGREFYLLDPLDAILSFDD